MSIGKIVTLEDNEKYLLLMETNQEGHKFYYANKLTDDEKTTSEYEIFEQTTEDGTDYLEIVLDEEIKEFLTQVFTIDMLEVASDIEEGKINLDEEIEEGA